MTQLSLTTRIAVSDLIKYSARDLNNYALLLLDHYTQSNTLRESIIVEEYNKLIKLFEHVTTPVQDTILFLKAHDVCVIKRLWELMDNPKQ